jgi:hypothetical protein
MFVDGIGPLFDDQQLRRDTKRSGDPDSLRHGWSRCNAYTQLQFFAFAYRSRCTDGQNCEGAWKAIRMPKAV